MLKCQFCISNCWISLLFRFDGFGNWNLVNVFLWVHVLSISFNCTHNRLPTFNFLQNNSCQTQLSTLKFAAIFILVFSFEFVYFELQLTNKLLFLQFQPLIWSISAPKFTCLFQFSSRFLIFFNQVLNCPSNFNIYAIKPLVWPN